MTSIKVKSPGSTEFRVISVAEVDAAVTDDPDFKRFKYTERVPAGEFVEVILEYELVKFARDHTVFLSNLPATNFKIELEYDRRLEVGYSSIHMRDLVNESPSESFSTLVLRTKGALLPSNGVEYWWRPKPLGMRPPATTSDQAGDPAVPMAS